MTQIWRIIQAELLSRTQDKSFWLEAFLLPAVITGVMGLALGNVGHGRTPSMHVGVVSTSKDALIPSVLETAYKATDSLKVEFFSRTEDAKARLTDRTLDAMVIVPDGDTTSSTDQTLAVTVESGRSTQFQATMVAQITEATLSAIAAEMGARKVVAEMMIAAGTDPASAWTTPSPVPVSARLERTPLKRFDALGAQLAGLASFFSMLSAFRLMTNIFAEHRRGLNLRLSGIPVRSGYVAVGYVGTVALVAFVQTSTVLVLGRLAFGVRWGSLLSLVLAGVVAAFASAAVGLALAGIPVSGSARALIGSLFVLGGGVLGGALVPIDGSDATLRFFSQATLHYWVTGLFTGLSRGLTLAEVSRMFVGVVTYGGVALILASVFLSRRRPGRA